MLEGHLGEIALKQQGYSTALAERVKAYHTANKKTLQSIGDPAILLLLVGKLDEAVALFAKNLENSKSIGTEDPFGIRQKIGIVTTIAKYFKFKETDIKTLLKKVIEINPYTVNKKRFILNGYLSKRIEQAMLS